MPGEPGYRGQHRIERMTEARQRVIDRHRHHHHPPIASQHPPAVNPLVSSAVPGSNAAPPVTAPHNITSASSASNGARPANGTGARPTTAHRARVWSNVSRPNGDSLLMPPPISRPRHAEPQRQIRRHSTQNVEAGPDLQKCSESGPENTAEDGQGRYRVPAPTLRNRRHSSHELPDLSPPNSTDVHTENAGPKKEQRRPASASSSMSGVEYNCAAPPVQTTEQTHGSQDRADASMAGQQRSTNVQAPNEARTRYPTYEEYCASVRVYRGRRLEDDDDCQITEVRTTQRSHTSSEYGRPVLSSTRPYQYELDVAFSRGEPLTQVRSDHHAQPSDTSMLQSPPATPSRPPAPRPPPQVLIKPDPRFHSTEYHLHRQQQERVRRLQPAHRQHPYEQPLEWYNSRSERGENSDEERVTTPT